MKSLHIAMSLPLLFVLGCAEVSPPPVRNISPPVAQTSETLRTLPGNVQPAIQQVTPAQHHDAAGTIEFSVYPQTTDGSPFSQASLDAIAAWATAHQLTFVGTEADGAYAEIRGTTSLVEAALHVTINDYDVDSPMGFGRYYSMDRDPQVPVTLPIDGFLSISNVPAARANTFEHHAGAVG